MEGPGGYQFVGRTVQMWNTYARGQSTQWLLRNFDQIRFYPVSAEELLELREQRGAVRMEDRDFRLKEYQAFLASIQQEATEWKRRQQGAFLEERERWGADTILELPDSDPHAPADEAVPEGCRAVFSPVTASVWSIAAEPGQRLEAGQRLIVLEAMKMEIAVTAPVSGTLEKLHCTPGVLVLAGQQLATIRI
jgi:urea carboxylase